MRKFLVLFVLLACGWSLRANADYKVGVIQQQESSSGGAGGLTLVTTATTADMVGNGASKTIGPLSLQSGDIVVVAGVSESSEFDITLSEDGAASLSTVLSYDVTNYTVQTMSTYTAATTESVTFNVNCGPCSGPGAYYGGAAWQWRGATGVGANNSATSASGLPSVGLTTTAANSAIVAFVGDWSANSTNGVWSASPTTAVEVIDYGDDAHYGVHAAHFLDAGSTGAKTISMTAPSAQKYWIGVIEIKAN